MWKHLAITEWIRLLSRFCNYTTKIAKSSIQVLLVEWVKRTVKQAVNLLPWVFVFHMKENGGFVRFVVGKLQDTARKTQWARATEGPHICLDSHQPTMLVEKDHLSFLQAPHFAGLFFCAKFPLNTFGRRSTTQLKNSVQNKNVAGGDFPFAAMGKMVFFFVPFSTHFHF